MPRDDEIESVPEEEPVQGSEPEKVVEDFEADPERLKEINDEVQEDPKTWEHDHALEEAEARVRFLEVELAKAALKERGLKHALSKLEVRILSFQRFLNGLKEEVHLL